jgi:O-antigen/teichoic acid export membrane protein
MGIIIKQSLKGSIWSYLGLVVGYINVGIIMPNFFRTDQVGLIQLFVALAAIFTNFSSLGFNSVINRIFPEFRNKAKNHNGFLFITLATGLLGFFLSAAAFFIFKPHIIESNIHKSPLLVEYILLLVPLFFFRIMFRLLDNFNKVLYDAVTGTFWNDFGVKLTNLVLIVLFATQVINFRQFFFGYIVSMSFPVLPLIVVLIRRGEFNLQPNLNFLSRPLVREMLTVAGFGLIMGLSGTLTANIDKLLINKFLSLEQVGIFSVCALFATVILIPSRSTAKISTGIIAQSWKNNNTAHIQEIYSKASLNQTIIGALIFTGILVNLDNIFTILPDVYEQGRWVLIIYAFGTLIRVSATTSGNIIATSKHYRMLAIFIGSQIIYTVGFHYLFIPRWGITGAAIGVLLTYFVRTLLIVGYIQLKMKMFCYSFKHLGILVIAAVAFLVGFFIPETESLILNILIKSISTGVVYIVLILGLNISEDIKSLYQTLLRKLFKKLR